MPAIPSKMSMTEMMRGKSMPADKKNDIKLAQHGEIIKILAKTHGNTDNMN